MKESYLPPTLEVHYMLQEETIAAISYSTVSFGDQTDPYNPLVEDWDINTLETDEFEL